MIPYDDFYSITDLDTGDDKRELMSALFPDVKFTETFLREDDVEVDNDETLSSSDNLDIKFKPIDNPALDFSSVIVKPTEILVRNVKNDVLKFSVYKQDDSYELHLIGNNQIKIQMKIISLDDARKMSLSHMSIEE